MNPPFSQQQTKTGQLGGMNPVLFGTPVVAMLTMPIGGMALARVARRQERQTHESDFR